MQSFPAIPFLLFLCSPKESLRQVSKKELVHFFEREQTSPKVTKQKKWRLRRGKKILSITQACRRNDAIRFALHRSFAAAMLWKTDFFLYAACQRYDFNNL